MQTDTTNDRAITAGADAIERWLEDHDQSEAALRAEARRNRRDRINRARESAIANRGY